jgi:hypothetical protein
MLTTHAIMYITQQYVDQSIKDIYTSVLVPYPHDLEMATSQPKYKVYTKNEPMFYQDDPNGNVYAKNFTYNNLEKEQNE